MRPDRLVVRAYLSRGTKLWVLTRAASSGVFMLAESNPLALSGAAILGIVALSTLLGFLETWLRHESVLLGNLGISPLVLGVFFFVPALFGEAVLRFMGAVLW